MSLSLCHAFGQCDYFQCLLGLTERDVMTLDLVLSQSRILPFSFLILVVSEDKSKTDGFNVSGNKTHAPHLILHAV